LDVHTSRWIIDKCFKGELLRNRTVLLVTHNIALASPIASFVVSLGTDGRILSQGSLSEALAKDETLAAEIVHETTAIELNANEEAAADETEGDAVAKPQEGKLIVAEEIAVGRVGWPACEFLLRDK
jgi:ABC-type methionine transport system ATPase subunit